MAELLETERTYVKDLELAVNCYLKPMLYSSSLPNAHRGADFTPPNALKGKESVIFANLEEILLFHKDIFLKELEKYEMMPEDVGHCFVTWVIPFIFIYIYYVYIYSMCVCVCVFLLDSISMTV